MSKSLASLEVLALRKQINDLKEAAVTQRRTETALRDAVEVARTILDEIPCALCRIRGSGQVLYANDAMAEFLGYESRQELTLLLPVLGVFLHPDQFSSLCHTVPEPPAYIDATGLFRRKDGSGCSARFRLRPARQGSDYTIAIIDETRRG